MHNNGEKQAKGCIADAYALQILFVYSLTPPSLLHPSILLFFILVGLEVSQDYPRLWNGILSLLRNATEFQLYTEFFYNKINIKVNQKLYQKEVGIVS